MPDQKYTGSPTGSGNPPGQYSKSYLSSSESGGHFISSKGYRGSMNVGVNSTASEIGNQPKNSNSATLESRANKEMSY